MRQNEVKEASLLAAMLAVFWDFIMPMLLQCAHELTSNSQSGAKPSKMQRVGQRYL